MTRKDTRAQRVYPKPVCAYCGGLATTRDHVLPKLLFGDPLPLEMITVPACVECNAEKKHLDEYVRDCYATDMRMMGHPLIQSQLFDRAMRALDRKQSWLPSAITSINPAFSDLVTESGIIIGQGRAVTFDVRPIYRWFRFVVQGLTFWQFRQRVPASASHMVMMPDPTIFAPTFQEQIEAFAAMPGFHGFYVLGPDVVRWAVTGSGPQTAVWFFVLFGRVPVTVFMWPPNALQIMRDRMAAPPKFSEP